MPTHCGRVRMYGADKGMHLKFLLLPVSSDNYKLVGYHIRIITCTFLHISYDLC